MASTSASASSVLARTASKENIRNLYRTLLVQAKLLSYTLEDPVVYRSHRYLARKNLQPIVNKQRSALIPDRLSPNIAGKDESDSGSGTEWEAEDAMLGARWPPSTATKRILKAKIHRRQLSDANQGWEHAVFRAVSLAYGRSGKIRRDALSELSPQLSTDPSELEQPPKLRKKIFSPILQALLTSSNSMDGAPVKDVAYLTTRPPPPYLPSEDDPLVKYFGKAKGRRRIMNASKKFTKMYLKKALPPLEVVTIGADGYPRVPTNSIWKHLEDKARQSRVNVASIPTCLSIKQTERKDDSETKLETREAGNLGQTKPFLRQARIQALEYCSGFVASRHRKRALREQGWTSRPKDFSRPRLRSRMYAKILDQAPFMLLPAANQPDDASEATAMLLSDSRVKDDPIGMRAKLRFATVYASSGKIVASKIKVLKSTFALGPSNQKGKEGQRVPPDMFRKAADKSTGLTNGASSTAVGADPLASVQYEGLDETEIHFLRRQGMM